MITLFKDLNPLKKYGFHTSPSGRSKPFTVKQFLGSSFAKEELLCIDEELEGKSVLVWSKYEGWDAAAYSELVQWFVSFIDASQEVNPEFVDSAIEDELSVSEAVSSWFLGTSISVEVEHHLQGASGFLDIDIEGISSVRRVVIAPIINKGDMFNVYYGDSSKGGAFWNIDLVTTLKAFFKREDPCDSAPKAKEVIYKPLCSVYPEYSK